MKSILYAATLIICIGCNSHYSTEAELSSKKGTLETKVVRGGLIWSLDWSPDDKYIACGNASGLLRIYNATSLELVQVLTGFKATINGIHWSPDGKKIVASGGNEDPRVILWSLEEKSNLVISDHTRQVRSVSWSPKGTYFASTSHDGTIRIWNPEGKFVTMFTGANGGCVGIDWLDEDVITASCWDNTIRTYSITGGDSLLIENGNHRSKAVLAVDWHPSGEFFATGEMGNEGDTAHVVKLWTSYGELISQMDSHEKEIRSLSWNKDGSLLATGGETVRLWNKEGELLRIFEPVVSNVWSLDWNSKGDELVSGHTDGKIRFWNTKGELLRLLDGHSSVTSSISFSRDSTELFMGFSDGTLHYYNLKSLTSSERIAGKRSVKNITWSPDQEHVAQSNNDGSFAIWSIANGMLSENQVYSWKDLSIRNLAWNPDSDLIAYLDNNSTISVYSLEGTLQSTLKTNRKEDNRIIWKDGKPIGAQEERTYYPLADKVDVTIGGDILSLIPLSNNRFALIDERSNRIVRGDKNDFVEIIELWNGFTRLLIK